MTELSHADLVKSAARWLAGSRKCGLVLVEPQQWTVGEFPDAIGWTPDGYSVLVECKVSRSDFHADKRKPSRRQAKESMGRERWYLTPPKLLREEDLPPGYGLLESRGKIIRKVVLAAKSERPGRQAAELPLLVKAGRKNGWILCKGYLRAVCIMPYEETCVSI